MRAEAIEPPPASTHTMESVAKLAEWWPSTAPRLLRVLRLRGVDAQRAEDLVQEAGTRALGLGMPFATAQDLYRWSACVVRNLHIDLTRESARLTSDDKLASVPAGEDVEHVADRRRALAAVIAAMALLSDNERRAVLAGVLTDFDEDDAPAGTIAVRRFRARRKLRAMTSGVLAWLGVSYARGARWLRPAGDSPALISAAVVVSIATGVLGTHAGSPARDTPKRSLVTSPVEQQHGNSDERATTRSAPAVSAVRKPSFNRPASVAMLPVRPARTEFHGPAGTGAGFEKRAAEPDEPILCVRGAPVIPPVCTPDVPEDEPRAASPR